MLKKYDGKVPFGQFYDESISSSSCIDPGSMKFIHSTSIL